MILPAVYPPTATIEILSNDGGRTLVGAIELVSPGNKDRPAKRRLFAAKCATYLSRGVGLIIVDVVSSRQGNMHNELIDLVGLDPAFRMDRDQSIYAVAYRPLQDGAMGRVEAWPTPLAVGEVFNSIWDCQELISNRWIDYIRCATTHTGGITHMKRILDLADLSSSRADGAIFDGPSLARARLESTSLRSATFHGATLTNARLVMRLGLVRVLRIGACTLVAVAGLFFLLAAMTDGHPPFWAYCVSLAFLLPWHTLLLANCNTAAMGPVGRAAGTAAEYRGVQEPLAVIAETIAVKGGESVRVAVRITRHGPLIANTGAEFMALRWTATEPDGFYFPFVLIDRARNWTEFRDALRTYPGPAQNFVFADIDGNIGYQAAGNLPIRRNYAGDLPVDGSSGGITDFAPILGKEIKYSYQVPLSEYVRRHADIMTMAVGLIIHGDQAEQILQDQQADLIAVGREILNNPNWPMDAALKLGVEGPFRNVPPQFGYWLGTRAKRGFGTQPSTWQNGLNATRKVL